MVRALSWNIPYRSEGHVQEPNSQTVPTEKWMIFVIIQTSNVAKIIRNV